MRILFIEDNPEFLGYVSELLRTEGHEVIEVDNADAAVNAIKDVSSYDLVILDIMLMLGSIINQNEANETGIAIYKRIRKIDKNIRILVLSARGKGDIWDFFCDDLNATYHGKPIPSDYQKFSSNHEV